MLAVIECWPGRALTVACATLLASSMSVAADAAPSARHVVETVMSEVVDELQSHGGDTRDDRGRMNEIVERLVIPHFDFERMSRRVLGKRWKSATADQQTRFVSAFQTMLVHTYGAVLNEYDGHTVTYFDPVPRKKEGEVVVPVQIEDGSGTQVRVAYAMHHHGTEWKVFDVAIDGVSLVTNYRSSFRSKIARDGIDGLISSIEERNLERDT